jgi:hypothetical protein
VGLGNFVCVSQFRKSYVFFLTDSLDFGKYFFSPYNLSMTHPGKAREAVVQNGF